MIDPFMASKIAKREYEERIRSLTPVQDHDGRLKDDRQLSVYRVLSGIAVTHHDMSGRMSRQAQRLLYALSSGLRSLGTQLKRDQNISLETSLKDPEHDGMPG